MNRMLKNNPYLKTYLNTINESVDFEKYQRIADEIHGEYIPETNTFDCMGNDVCFHNEWLNRNNSFDFKLINTSDDWNDMFRYCHHLQFLPEHFAIPSHVKWIECMFHGCCYLTHLPEGFTIPDGITSCDGMFVGCISLQYLPESFTLPKSVKEVYRMFSGCTSLKSLPVSFHIPNDCQCCSTMFENCDQLDDPDYRSYLMIEV